jgi:hypothetical protein
MDTFQKWVINLPNIDKKMNRTYSNFCNLFDELKEDGKDKEYVESIFDELIEEYQPSDSLIKRVAKQNGAYDIDDYKKRWIKKIKAEALRAINDVFPQTEKLTVNGMSREEYRSIRAIADSFTSVDLSKVKEKKPLKIEERNGKD